MPNILLVEDDEALSFEIKRAIEHEGHDVAKCSNIADARLILKDKKFDLIVLDWGLPDGSGVDLCVEIRQAGENAAHLNAYRACFARGKGRGT